MDLRRLLGTLADRFRIGINGPMWKSNSGISLAARDAADASFSRVQGADPTGNNDLVTKQYHDAAQLSNVPTTRLVDTSEGIQGGGDLSSDRTHRLNITGLNSLVDLDLANDHTVVFDASGGVHKKVLIKDFLGTTTALTVGQHETLRQLIHFLHEGGPGNGFSGAHREMLPNADPFPTQIIWWTDSGKTLKISEEIITRNANKTPSTIVTKVYQSDGVTVAQTATDTIAYTGVVETSRTRLIS